MAYIVISFVILATVVIFVLVKGTTLVKKYLNNKKYINCYKSILHNEENAYEKLCSFINDTKDSAFLNQALVLKLLYEASNDLNYQKTLDDISIKDIFYENDEGKIEKIQSNRDIYLFIIISMSKAYEKNHLDIIENLMNKLNELKDLDSIFEHNMAINFAKAVLNLEDKGTSFMVGTLDGNYSSYIYDKYQISLYRKIAASILFFKKINYDENANLEVKEFAKSLIGARILTGLGIYKDCLNIDNKAEIESKE